jgi:hypothetical protein
MQPNGSQGMPSHNLIQAANDLFYLFIDNEKTCHAALQVQVPLFDQ